MTSKYTTKQKDSYTADKKVLAEFKKLAKENNLNKSSWIESKLKEYIEQNKK